jgi:hypothetical protein
LGAALHRLDGTEIARLSNFAAGVVWSPGEDGGADLWTGLTIQPLVE